MRIHAVCSPLALFAAFALLWYPVRSGLAQDNAENLILVTLDGVRWQEVFGGIDAALIEDERFGKEPEYLKETYWREQKSDRREVLFPFLWSVIASEGVLIGDRHSDSFMEVSNDQWFSYPGYNEILTGRADPDIDSNAKIWNPNVTLLEVLNEQEDFRGRVLAFGSWDVFPYIVNSRRSQVPVNAGFATAADAVTAEAQWLNDASAKAPKLWSTVRLDFLTHGYAMDALNSKKPRVIYIAYGETDDFAHDGNYDRYIDAAQRTDAMLSQLWSWAQATPGYRGRTALMITTDHGRGSVPDSWDTHDNIARDGPSADSAPDGLEHSNEIWFAAIGPCIRQSGLIRGHFKQSQVAATAMACLNQEAKRLMPKADGAMIQVLR